MEECVAHSPQSVQDTNSNLASRETSNHFRIVEYASFNLDRISNSLQNVRTISVPHITSLPHNDNEIQTTTEPPNYSTVQPKAKRSSQPQDSESSPQDTQCSSTTAQTTDEADFVVRSSASLVPKSYDACEAGVHSTVVPSTVTSIQITLKRPSLKGSNSFCCVESAAMNTMSAATNTLSMDIPMAERIKSNSFSKITDADKLSFQNLIAHKNKPLPPLPSQPPGAFATASISSTPPTNPESWESPISNIPSGLISSMPTTPIICIENDSLSLVSAYEVPVRSNSLNTDTKEPDSAQQVGRSFSFSVNQEPSHKMSSSPVLVLPNANERTGAGHNEMQCPNKIVQFSASTISLPHPEQPSLTTV